MNKTIVSVIACPSYEFELVRQAVAASLAPLGGMGRFVRPGMRVLLKPNLLSAHEPERAVTTHPAVVRVVAELVQEAGGTVLVGDSPAGPIEDNPAVWRQSGIGEAAEQVGAEPVLFDSVTWKRLREIDYFIARPVLEADLVINLPKLKTHTSALYTGAVKNLFGVIPGNRKREVHARALSIDEFSAALVDVLELVRPPLTIMDAVLGQEGNGPGRNGTPRRYGCLAASEDPVALDAVMTHAMGYRPGHVMLLAQAASRGLGVADLETIHIQGDLRSVEFGRVRLPAMHWYLHAPGWVGTAAQRAMRVRPRLVAAACASCGRCVEVCPRHVITMNTLPDFDLDECVGCFCCAEVCPQGAIEPQRSLLARLVGAGR